MKSEALNQANQGKWRKVEWDSCFLLDWTKIEQTVLFCSAWSSWFSFDKTTGLSFWEIKFCIDDYEIVSVTNSTLYSTQVFTYFRPIPVGYLRSRMETNRLSFSYQV